MSSVLDDYFTGDAFCEKFPYPWKLFLTSENYNNFQFLFHFSSKKNISILVPGAGLARLMFDIARLGKMAVQLYIMI